MPPTDPQRPDRPSRRQAHRVFTWAALGGLVLPGRSQAGNEDRPRRHVTRYPILLNGEFHLQYADPDAPLCGHRGCGIYGERSGAGEFLFLPAVEGHGVGDLDGLCAPGVHTAAGTFFAIDLVVRVELATSADSTTSRPWLTLPEIGGPGVFHLISLDDCDR